MMDLGSVVSLGRRRTPHRLAVKHADGPSSTYQALDDRSTRLANALLGLGARRGDRVACWLDDSIEYVETYVAIAKAGLVLVPVNRRLTIPEADYQLEQSGARVIVYSAELVENVAELSGLGDYRGIAIGLDSAPPPIGAHYEDLLASASDQAPSAPDPDAPFLICYTSGTTGRPKGAVLTHRSINACAVTQFVATRIPVNPVHLHAVSMSWPATVTCQIIPTLMAGGTNVLVGRPWDTERLLDLVHGERVTFLNVPGPALEEFTAAVRARPERWQSLTAVLHAGSRADPLALERLSDVVGARYVEAWGMTENSGGLLTATSPRDVPDPHRAASFFSSVGRPLPGVEIAVIGEDGEILDRGSDVVGELIAKSNSLFAGYWNAPEATAEAMRDGWYLTGDMGSLDVDGSVSISDRRTNMIGSGGMNIYPAEIELVLERCPGVAEVGVAGAPHERWGQTPVALVVCEPGVELVDTEIIDFARQHLASYKKPTRVVFVDSLPRTVGGKLARAKLRELVQGNEAALG